MIHAEDIVEDIVKLVQDVGSAPYFMLGDPLTLSNTLVRVKSTAAKYPVVILIDDVKEELVRDNVAAVDVVASIRLFFMTKANTAWKSDDHMDKAVKPMRLLTEQFQDLIEKDVRVQSIKNVDRHAHTNWGLKVDADGRKKSVFPDWLSGVEMTFDLMVFKAVKIRN